MQLTDTDVVLVTGGASGLGAATVASALSAGARAVIVDLPDAVAALPPRDRVTALGADVRDEDQVQAAVDAAQRDGVLRVVVNCAGVATPGRIVGKRGTLPLEEFRRVIDINLNGSYWMAQACGRVMQPGSSIVNIGSVLGSTTAGLPQAAYSASKAAIIGLTRDLAQQWTGRKGIRVNALAPGFFPSEMTDEYPEGYLDRMIVRVPAGRPGDPAELTCAVVFLAADASSFVTGVLLPVDGGMLTS